MSYPAKIWFQRSALECERALSVSVRRRAPVDCSHAPRGSEYRKLKAMLALVGSGEYLPGMDGVDRILLDRLDQAPKVVCLPTAAGTEGADRIGYWARLGETHFTRLGVDVESVPVIDRADAENPRLAERVAGANLVYLSGGKPDYLFKTLDGTPVWAAIQGVLAAGGILAGCSAGAMILGERMFAFPGWKPAFGLVSGAAIIPHFDEIPRAMSAPLRLFTGSDLTILGVDGYTALVVSPGGWAKEETYEVLGSGGVTVWNRESKIRYTQGFLPDWRVR